MAIQQAVEAGDRACIAAAKADAFVTNAWCMDAIQWIHESVGLPWWGAIVAINIGLRACTMPLAFLSQKFSSDAVMYNLRLSDVKKLYLQANHTADGREAERMKRRAAVLYEAHQAQHGSPMKQLIKVPAAMMGSFFVFITIFNSVRGLMDSGAYSLATGGALWFTDLTAPDPYWGLPILCSATTIALVKFGLNLDQASSASQNPAQVQMVKYFMYFAGAMFIPFGHMVPAGVGLLWVTNGWVQVVQGKLVRNGAVRKAFGLPTVQEMQDMNKRVKAVQDLENPQASQSAVSEEQAKELAGAQLVSQRLQRPATPAPSSAPATTARPGHVYRGRQQGKQRRFE